MYRNWKKRLGFMCLTLIVLTIMVLFIQATWGNAVLSLVIEVVSMMLAVMSFFLSEKVLFSQQPIEPNPPLPTMSNASLSDEDFFDGGIFDQKN